jgi:hypothetical protein
LRYISIGYGGESISQSSLKDQAFSTFLDQNPPFELPAENGDFACDTPVQWTVIDNSATPAPSWTALPWPPSANPPVVGLTLRYDRADNSWSTLLRELSHISLHYEFLRSARDCPAHFFGNSAYVAELAARSRLRRPHGSGDIVRLMQGRKRNKRREIAHHVVISAQARNG